MNIIIEGLDNVGKSTQIKKLLGKLHKYGPIHVIHYSAIPGLNGTDCIYYSEKLYEDMFNIITNNSSIFILDRAHLGEYVYGYIYRDYNADYIFDIEKKYNLDDVFLFTLYDEPKNLIKREDGESFSIELDKKELEIDRFIEATLKSNIKNKLLINIDKLNENEVHEKIWTFIKDKMK